ncbi:MAG: sodium:dicarboxylate symporter [Epulopiscium sp. Nuni2H_MBin001]|nr:MAG: sodium:dicarboxylate symporter [Epulopiscium sp. Nuni2H_MBin001]
MQKLKDELVFRLIIAVAIGLGLGLVVNESLMLIILTIRDVLSQIIFFTIPLIILGFVAPSIASLKSGATKLLSFAVTIAYLSTLGAAVFAMVAGYIIVPALNIPDVATDLRALPELIFSLQITPIMSVMSALALSLMLGVAVAVTGATTFEKLLNEFQAIVLKIVTSLIIPILPVFICATFARLAYQGTITQQLPVFLVVILIAIVGHFIWLAVLYGVAGIYSGQKPSEVYKNYAPAYFTAVGTMSSAATLPVSLKCADKSRVLSKDSIDFGIPLFANIHLCGSVLTEVFFVMTVSMVLYGSMPSVANMIVFVVLLGIFGIGAPGVPGGTVMASLGLITGVLGFDVEGTALMMTIFALQDSFGTACNVTGDGALTLMLSKYMNKIESKNI